MDYWTRNARMYQQDNHAYLITELAEKGTLTKAIDKGMLDWPTMTRLAQEVARGLEYIHRENVLHGDLMSANVLLTWNMEAKLADFVLARIRSALNDSLPMSSPGGSITGTLGWMAPELLDADKLLYSTKTDVYALGMVIWEMAANCTRPYKEQGIEESIVQYDKSGHREKLPDDTPAEYREWVESCWHQDPDQRPDASEVILVHDQQEDTGDDNDDSVRISLTIGDDDKITLVSWERELTAMSHPSSATAAASGHLTLSIGDAVKYFCQEAQQGNGDAQLLLGTWYSLGRGVDQSDVEASKWFTKAAEHGNKIAQYSLGWRYQDGQGVKKSDTKAVKWYTKAAEQRDASAQNNLGWMYQEGLGVEQSNAETVKWYIKAAEQGNAEAQNSLGCMYQEGRGVEQSDAEVVKWYTKAAEQGNETAQKNLGYMYRERRGVAQSDVEAIKRLTKAAEQGDAGAQDSLEEMNQKN
ncbi:hypothetical protein BGW42_003697 [Actinomortierella wolfii]|nr:hypothetical protein BGW42_003697 [Actinomortierella wolfii]